MPMRYAKDKIVDCKKTLYIVMTRFGFIDGYIVAVFFLFNYKGCRWLFFFK